MAREMAVSESVDDFDDNFFDDGANYDDRL